MTAFAPSIPTSFLTAAWWKSPGSANILAVDTGSAVIYRTAAHEGGHTSAERNAIVVDIFFENRSEGERFAASAAKYVSVTLVDAKLHGRGGQGRPQSLCRGKLDQDRKQAALILETRT